MQSFGFHPVNGGSLFGHLGQAAQVAHDPRAPEDERSDAAKETFRQFYDPGSVAGPDLRQVISEWAKLMQAEKNARALQKSLKERQASPADPKAQTESGLWKTAASGLYLSKPGIPFVTLRQMGRTVEVAQAAHRTRIRQVLAFSQRSQKDDIVGWRLKAKDPNATLGDDHTAFLAWLSDWVQNGGDEESALRRRRLGRQGIRTFLSLLTDDSLTMDHAAVETVPYREGPGLSAFFLRDSATFFLSRTFGDADADDIYAYQDLIRNAGKQQPFRYEELAIFQRNLSSDVDRVGYGYSELEASLDTLGNFLQAMAYTREGLDNNAIPRGILVLSGSYSPEQMTAFQAMWQAKVRGVQNAHGLPVLQSRGQQGDVKYVQTSGQISEMAFVKWISLQASIFCSIYGMDPMELSMEAFSASSRGPLAGDDTAERLAAARDKGLAPFLADIESFVTDELIARWVPWAQFQFCGVNPGDLKAKADLTARMQTIDEARASLGLPKHPIAWLGALPADASLQSAEFQRASAVFTLNEGRRAWGGLDEYPNPIMGATPLNPSLQASYNQAIQGQGGGDEQDGEDPFAGEGEDAEAGASDGPPEDEGGGGLGGPPESAEAPTAGAEVARRLEALKGGA
jgi:hypothetical protein